MTECSDVGVILAVFLRFCSLEGFGWVGGEVGGCVRLDDSDVSEESLSIGHFKIRLPRGMAVEEWRGFDLSEGTGVSGMTIESLNNPVVASECSFATGGVAAEGVNVGVRRDRGVAERTGARGEKSIDWDAETKLRNETEVSVRE